MMNWTKFWTRTALVVATLFSTTALFAQSDNGLNPYTDCGIGRALFENDVAATISNVIWDLGTTAVISATASPETCEGGEAVAATLIFETYAEISEQTAKGEGEHLVALMDIASCSAESRPQFVQSLRSGYSEILADSNYAETTQLEKAETFYKMYIGRVNGDFSATCSMS